MLCHQFSRIIGSTYRTIEKIENADTDPAEDCDGETISNDY